MRGSCHAFFVAKNSCVSLVQKGDRFNSITKEQHCFKIKERDRHMKKISIIFLIVILMQTVGFAVDYPQKFYDVPKDHWAFSQIAELVDRGAISGYQDGSYKPNNTVTRAEWAKIMIKAANKNLGSDTSSFSDMSGHWANPYVNASKEYMTSYAGGKEFRPDIAILREDVTVALVKLKGYSTDNVDFSYIADFNDPDSISASCKQYVALAVEKGLISGFEDGTFRGQDTLTRAEAATLLWRAFQKGNDDKVIVGDNDEYAVVTNAPQSVSEYAKQENTTPAPAVTPKPEKQSEVTVTPKLTPTPKPYRVDTVTYGKDVTSIIKDGDTVYYIDGDTVYSYKNGTTETLTSAEDLLKNAPEAGIEIDAGANGTVLPEDKPDGCHLLSLIYDYENNLPFLFVSYDYRNYAGFYETYLLTDMSKPYVSSDELITPFYNLGAREATACTIENGAIYFKRTRGIDRFDLKTGVSSKWKDVDWVVSSVNMFKVGNEIFQDRESAGFAVFINFEVRNKGYIEAVKYAAVNSTLYFTDRSLNFYKVTNIDSVRAEEVISADDIDILDGKEFVAPKRVEKAEMFYDGKDTVLFFDKNNKSIREITKR